jgi:7-keto-8-aminopelargonate synthetase-like enzyme
MGGAAGGYTTGPKELIDLLRQRGRPYLFSNSLPPPVVAAGIKVSIAVNYLLLIKKKNVQLSYIGRFSFQGQNLFVSPIFHPFKYNVLMYEFQSVAMYQYLA